FGYGFLINGTMAQFEVVTFGHITRNEHRYARLRVWGSIGFVVVVLGLGPLLETLGVQTLPWWIVGMFLITLLTGLRIPEPFGGSHATPAPGGLMAVLRQPAVIALLAACLLAQLSYGPYYSFFSIYLEDHGYRKSVIGLLWSLGVVAEVLM